MASDPVVADTPTDAGTMLMEKSLLLQGVASGPAFQASQPFLRSIMWLCPLLLQAPRCCRRPLLLQIYKLLQVVLLFRPPCFS
jgi:hypothetical protein